MSLPMKPLLGNPDLDALLKKAVAAFEALTPAQQREHRLAQRKSWCVGETMLEHPEMTREEAVALYERVIEQGVL